MFDGLIPVLGRLEGMESPRVSVTYMYRAAYRLSGDEQ